MMRAILPPVHPMRATQHVVAILVVACGLVALEWIAPGLATRFAGVFLLLALFGLAVAFRAGPCDRRRTMEAGPHPMRRRTDTRG